MLAINSLKDIMKVTSMKSAQVSHSNSGGHGSANLLTAN